MQKQKGYGMDWTNLCLFLAASWLLIITPGPDTLYVLMRGLSQGRRAGCVSALGVACGILVHTLFAALGLAVVLRTSALAFALVKYAGAGYLIFLGIRALFSRSALRARPDAPRAPSRTIFLQGLLTNVLNPKIALFFLAFLPQFVSPGQLDAATQMLLLGLSYALCSTLYLALVSLFSGSLGAWCGKNSRMAHALGKLTGGVFIALGIKLFFARQASLS